MGWRKFYPKTTPSHGSVAEVVNSVRLINVRSEVRILEATIGSAAHFPENLSINFQKANRTAAKNTDSLVTLACTPFLRNGKYKNVHQRNRVSRRCVCSYPKFIDKFSESCALQNVPMVGLRGLEPPTLRLSGVRSNHRATQADSYSRRWSSVELPPPELPSCFFSIFRSFSAYFLFHKERKWWR